MPARWINLKTWVKGKFAQLRGLAKVSGWISQPEQEQSILRVSITALILLYLLFGGTPEDFTNHSWLLGIEIVASFLTYSIILLAVTMVWPKPSVPRRVISVFGDVGITTLALYLTGPVGATWYGVYLWVTLGNGFRYGEKFLYLSGALSLVGFGMVVFVTPYWQRQSELAVGLAVTLLVIPAYSAVLIRRLNEALEHADTASRAKSDFLSRMSHEIRTPLNGILGMTDLLRTRPLEDEDREYVETIYASGKTLAHQIDEILDLSKIEAGQLVLENLEFDLYALINTTLRIFEAQLSEKQIQLQESINPNTPYLLYGDPHKLRQIFINLVGNSIKFTEQGFVSLRVYPREQTREQVTLRFEVVDTGTGIASDRLESIFDPFAQADCSVARNYGGTGLGTTICKNLVELMGGEIGVQSMPKVGTTFWFDIPFQICEQLLSAKDLSWAGECRLLCWRTQKAVSENIVSALSDRQVQCTQITSIDELEKHVASAANARYQYDALLIDGLAYGDEFEYLFQRLENDPLFSSLCVVLVNVEQYPPGIGAGLGDRLFGLNATVDERVFFNALHACYSRHSNEDDVVHIARKQIKIQCPSTELEVLIADDNATNRLVLQRMLQKMGHRSAAVTGGEAVLSMLEQKHYDVVIVDKNMPDMGGIDVFHAYSMAYGGQGKARFVVLTADATSESRDACQSAGIEYFLTKPVSLVKLQEVLSDVTAANQGFSQLSEKNIDTPEQCENILAVVDDAEFEKLQLLAGSDSKFMSEIVANFECDADRDLLGLESAVARHDWVAFRDSAHALKGAAMYLGLQRLAALSVSAQNVGYDEFEHCGITKVKELRKAADIALQALHDKLDFIRKMG